MSTSDCWRSFRSLASQVNKKVHGAYMTCKAFNSRIISQWLLDCATHADEGSCPASPDRLFGKWLEQNVACGNCRFPRDERFVHQRLALTLGFCVYAKRIFSFCIDKSSSQISCIVFPNVTSVFCNEEWYLLLLVPHRRMWPNPATWQQ